MENKNEPTTQITIYTYNICYISSSQKLILRSFLNFRREITIPDLFVRVFHTFAPLQHYCGQFS